MAIPAETEIDSIIDVVRLVQFEPDPYSRGGQKFLELKFLPLGGYAAKSDESNQAQPIRQLLAKFDLGRKLSAVLKLAARIAAQIIASIKA